MKPKNPLNCLRSVSSSDTEYYHQLKARGYVYFCHHPIQRGGLHARITNMNTYTFYEYLLLSYSVLVTAPSTLQTLIYLVLTTTLEG